jgi:hypothetical protein
MTKRDEIDTDPSSPQSRRGSTDPGIGPRSRTPAPGTARTPAPGTADSIDEILEGITNRPRVDGAPTPRVLPQTDGHATASYQSNARAPNPATTNPGPRPAVILSPSVEMQALEEKVPSSMPRPLVRDASPRPAYVAPLARNEGRSEMAGGRGRSDVDTVLTPSAMFKRFLRRAVVVAVVLALVLLVVASWKRGRTHDASAAAPTVPTSGIAGNAAEAPAPAVTANANVPSVAAISVTAARGATLPPSANAGSPSPAANAAVANAAPSAAISASASARVSPRGSASSPLPKVGSGLDSQGSAPKAPPPPAPGYEEFKKSFTP